MSESRAATNQKDAARTRPELLHTNKYEIEIVDMDRVLDSKQQLVELYPNVNSNGKNNNTWKRYEFTFTSRWPYKDRLFCFFFFLIVSRSVCSSRYLLTQTCCTFSKLCKTAAADAAAAAVPAAAAL